MSGEERDRQENSPLNLPAVRDLNRILSSKRGGRMKRETLLGTIVFIEFVFLLLLLGFSIARLSAMYDAQSFLLQTSIPYENGAYRKEIIAFARAEQELLEECAQEFYRYRAEQLQSNNWLVDSISMNGSGQLVAKCSQGEILEPDLPYLRKLLSDTIIERVGPSLENGVWSLCFETNHSDVLLDEGFYYAILYSASGRIETEGYHPVEGGWTQTLDDDVFYLEEISEHFYYSFEAWD